METQWPFPQYVLSCEEYINCEQHINRREPPRVNNCKITASSFVPSFSFFLFFSIMKSIWHSYRAKHALFNPFLLNSKIQTKKTEKRNLLNFPNLCLVKHVEFFSPFLFVFVGQI